MNRRLIILEMSLHSIITHFPNPYYLNGKRNDFLHTFKFIKRKEKVLKRIVKNVRGGSVVLQSLNKQ